MPNVFTHLILAALVWTGSSLWSPGQCREPGTRPTPFTVDAARDPDLSLRLRWTIAPGTYLYRDKIAATDASGRELPVSTQPGETKDDPNFGPTKVYHGATEAIVPGAALAGVREVRVTYQGCAEKGICYPPISKVIEVPAPGPQATAATPATDAQPEPRSGLLSGHLAGVLATFLGLGLLLAFTPCVLPMVPVLAGMLARSGERLSAGRGFVLSGTYVIAMALAYGTLGVAAAWSGRNLQVALQTPAALGLLAAAFVTLALSMFGVFDLALPSGVSSRLSRLSGGKLGAFGAAAVMGFTSALIVGPCVTPPLAAALLYVAQTGDVARGAAALFALGLGMGLPLIAFGTFGAGILPKSGPWLVAAKQAFGVVFLGLAITMISRLVPSEVTLVLWGVLVIGVGVFVGAFDVVRAGAAGRLSKVAGIVAVTYGCALVVGAASGGTDPLRPLAGLGRAQAVHAEESRTVSSVPAFEAALAVARTEGRPVLVEFAADWCTVCRTNERTVLADAGIQARLKAVSVIRADVTRDDDTTRALMRRFEVVGPPTLILMRPDGGEVREARTEGELTVDDLKRRLALVGA
ncbi:protein-disulfide reductase DsbD [Methylorubrum extorquens]|uniref:Fused thiol:disulfide interchange protein n=1 Tax=Methylorubrum extorquens (strain ATCC 14718 / DSM 1338 / JCM 2805 / NCIMB 9133 / AM1) TaxID=272630 RepID=C5AY12_METEA|nr:protein-disulfide reductase DsbD [Methylorubrum extorquens]ACS39065.1 putative fused thiol:disulfide interchange protein precursor [Methylorubrum extorquens AM1]MCP1542829.1 thiol:disulfide interchange protein DsbD [Methylorubrum extorquens]MCP1589826.1 thiol:disulfide interchange protein DsbD [Methylorubrum extorquens]